MSASQSLNRATIARNATIEAADRLLNPKDPVDIDSILADVEEKIAAQQQAVDATEVQLDVFQACITARRLGNCKVVEESIQLERSLLANLERSRRGLLLIKARRDEGV